MKSKVVSNLEGMASIIGTFQGVSAAANDDEFINDILMRAHNKALDKFNIKAAEHSTRMGQLNRGFPHMYEYGVAGITPGPAVIADPTSQAARLWVFKSISSGKTINTFVQFRNAVVPNPKPAQRPDLKGVSSEIINKMSTRKYVFKRRAEMVEYGMNVRISPYRAKALIYPSRENESGVGFWNKNRNGGVMDHPLVSNISNNSGTKHKMAFTNFFLGWWNTSGETEVRVSANNSIASRIGHAQRAAKKADALKPAAATNINATAARAKKVAEKNMKRGTQL